MATIVEKTSDGIIYRAAKTYPVPDLDILTLLFGKHLPYPNIKQMNQGHLNGPSPHDFVTEWREIEQY